MIDLTSGTLIFIARVIDFALDLAATIDRMQRLARCMTGSGRIIPVLAEPRVLSPAAQRALAEAETRRNSDRR